MKKDKATKASPSWKQGRKDLKFFKNIFFYLILCSIAFLAIFILIYRHINKFNQQPEFVYQNHAPASEPALAPAPTPAPAPEYVLLQNELTTQNNRLAHVEATLNQWQVTPQFSHQLVALEILREVLEGHLLLSTLTLYLQKIPEPWTPPILSSISTITESKTYTQLQDSLVLPSHSHSHSLWKRVKNALKSFVRVRKLDEKGQYQEGHLDDVHRALRERNIQQALEVFGKLPPEEQAKLASWKQEAQNRLTLETIKQKMLLDLAGS